MLLWRCLLNSLGLNHQRVSSVLGWKSTIVSLLWSAVLERMPHAGQLNVLIVPPTRTRGKAVLQIHQHASSAAAPMLSLQPGRHRAPALEPRGGP